MNCHEMLTHFKIQKSSAGEMDNNPTAALRLWTPSSAQREQRSKR
jgi:hypothetical protein